MGLFDRFKKKAEEAARKAAEKKAAEEKKKRPMLSRLGATKVVTTALREDEKPWAPQRWSAQLWTLAVMALSPFS